VDEQQPQQPSPTEVNEEPSKEQILARRAQILHEIEEERGTKAITLIHRKEPWGEEGSVIEESERILQQIRETPPEKPIDLILHTTGASRFAAHMIAMALNFRKSKVTVIVPFYALSNGTLLALAGDEIMMEKYSILGTVEPQFGDMPAASVLSLTKSIPAEMVSDFMILLADKARMETENTKGFVKWLLEKKMNPDQVEEIADFVVSGAVTVSTPITLDVVRAMGLKVSQVPEKVYELFSTMEFGGEKHGTHYH
jgi:ClpP class serine protease